MCLRRMSCSSRPTEAPLTVFKAGPRLCPPRLRRRDPLLQHDGLQMSANRKYLKDALPRLYEDMEDTLKCDWPELLPQLARLYITRRCPCGDEDCRSFDCESDDPRYAPIGGRQPMSYAIARVDGWYQVSADGVLSGFEILSDYWDGALERGLVAAGFPIHPR